MVFKALLVGFTLPEKTKIPGATLPEEVVKLWSSSQVPKNLQVPEELAKVLTVPYHRGLPGPTKSDVMRMFGPKAKEIRDLAGLEWELAVSLRDEKLAKKIKDSLTPAELKFGGTYNVKRPTTKGEGAPGIGDFPGKK